MVLRVFMRCLSSICGSKKSLLCDLSGHVKFAYCKNARSVFLGCSLYLFSLLVSAQQAPEDLDQNTRPLSHCHAKIYPQQINNSAQDQQTSSSKEPLLYDAKPLDQGMVIKAEQVHYQPDKKLDLKGRVEINQGRFHAKSDRARIDQESHQANLEGSIVLSSPDLILRGDHAVLNLENQKVSVDNAEFSNPKTLINGKAEKISQPQKDSLIIHNGLFSSCPPESRSWAFASDKITLNRAEGFGQANNTRFLIHDIPVLYIPWFSFPIDNRRKSGFLYPTLGSSNTGRGLFVSTPYYFNLAPNFDATLTPSYISGRGVHNELEARHKSAFTDSRLMFGYIRDDNQFDKEQLASGKDYFGPRWGVKIEQDIKTFLGGWQGRLRYSKLSDNGYLDDLNQGLSIYRQDNLDRRAEFYFSQDNWRLGVLFQQFKSLDNLILAKEKAYQRLPEVNLDVNQSLGAFQLSWQNQYVYFYRDRQKLTGGDRVLGSRIRLRPRLSLPLIKNWGYMTPSVSVDQTDYFLQDYTPVNNHLSRTVPIYEFDTGLYFDRRSFFSPKTIKHSLEPRLYYVYSPAVSQDAIPNFDSALPSFNYQRLFSANRFTGGDRIADNNRLTVGITSRWTDINSGEDKAVISLGQIYHYNDRSVNIGGLGTSSRSDSLLASEILFRPFKGLELEMTGLWDARTKTTQEGNSRIRFYTQNYQSVFNVSHRYIRHELEQVDSSFITPIYNQLSLIGRWRYNLDNNRTIGSLAGVEYNSCCWRVQVLAQSYLNSNSQILKGVLFRFQLSGVGGFGQSTQSMDKKIPGYKAREALFN